MGRVFAKGRLLSAVRTRSVGPLAEVPVLIAPVHVSRYLLRRFHGEPGRDAIPAPVRQGSGGPRAEASRWHEA